MSISDVNKSRFVIKVRNLKKKEILLMYYVLYIIIDKNCIFDFIFE